MRCHICNAELSDKEIQYNNKHNDWDPCGKCLEVIDEVFSNDSEEVIDEQLDLEFMYMGNQEVIPMEEESD